MYLVGKNKNQTRAALRKAFKEGRLEVRRTYYDYYDSCHPPTETPDAPWELADSKDPRWVRDLKAGGPSVVAKSEGVFELQTGWSTYQVRIK